MLNENLYFITIPNQLIADLHAHFFRLFLKCYDDRALPYIVIP